MWRVAALLVGLVVVLVGSLILLARSFDSGPMPAALAKADELPVTLLDGRMTSVGKLIRPGLPTVISLWASWCGPCRKEAPVLADLRRRFGADRLNFVYLNAREPGGVLSDLGAVAQEEGIPLRDVASIKDGDLSRLTNSTTNAIPRTYVFDAHGTPEAMIVGYKPLALARVAGLLK